MRIRDTGALAVAGLVGSTAMLAGCGLSTAGGYAPTGELAGPLKEVDGLDGATVAVGSKNFSEQLVLGKIAVILLKSAGADTTDLTNIPGSVSAREAQLGGQVDLQWEYTGTAWITYQGHDTGFPDKQKQYEAIKAEDKKDYGLEWLPPAPMNNTYAFAATSETAEKLGVTKLSEVARLPVEQRTFCVENEFANRGDGFKPMLEKYGIPLGQGVPNKNVSTLDTGAVYVATDQGECNFGEVFTTDGRIKALDLRVLEDDKGFFPAYNVSVVLREEVLAEHPELEELFAPVAQKLTDEVLVELNAQVDVEGREPADVAFEWLRSEGFVA